MGRDRNGPATIFQLYVRTCLARPNIAESTQGPGISTRPKRHAEVSCSGENWI